MTTRTGHLTLFLFLSILACTLFQASTASAVACSGTNVGEIFYFGPINCGTVTNLGTANITDGAVVDIEGPKPCIGGCGGGTLVNKGTLNVGPLNQTHPYGGSLNVTPGGNLLNDGTININGTLKPDGTVDQSKSGTVVINGPYPSYANNFVTNNGTINMASGSTLSLKDPFGVLPNGSTLSGPGTINMNGGTLSGTGTINGTVLNNGGVVQPGNGGSGVLSFGGYTQGVNGRLDFNPFGNNPEGDPSHGVLNVTGPLSLNGTLSGTLLSGYEPSLGDRFGVLTCTGCTISESRLRLSLPTLASGQGWFGGFSGNTFFISVASAPVSSPEPGTLLFLGVGFVSLVAWQWKQVRAVRPPRS